MFDHLIGNQAIKDAIKRYLSLRRVPNSLLFAGPEGIGKKQFALELAKAIVCREPHDGESCGTCAACLRVGVFKFPAADDRDEHKKVIFGEHADVGQVIPYGRNVLVDAIRDLEKEANFRPFEAPARVFIVDEAHRMNDSASNALLKTLEEPPTTSHIFLITSKPNALLPTIRSRAQALRFGPIAAAELEHFLLTTHKYSQSDARMIASLTNGSVAAALSVDADEFRGRRNEAFEILHSAIVNRDIVDVLKRSEKIGGIKSTSEFEAFLDLLQTMVHAIWSFRNGGAHDSGGDDVRELAACADPEALATWLEQVERIRGALAVNINKKIAFDALLVRMASA
jgi:DNA polymerase III subunit delta'